MYSRTLVYLNRASAGPNKFGGPNNHWIRVSEDIGIRCRLSARTITDRQQHVLNAVLKLMSIVALGSTIIP